ncbi:MAG TPA: GNAT family N-acetyltransferase [Micromonosporaceae bacterium]|jgi:RimJ/RimL family protein N-acetyltransferase
MRFDSIVDMSEVDALVSLSVKRETSARFVTSLLEDGESRPRWCRIARADDGTLLAAHVLDSWSPDGAPGEVPTSVHLLGHVDEAAAVALLAHDLIAFGAQSVATRVVIDTDASLELRTLRQAQPTILQATGFRFEVDRVRLTWRSSAQAPRPAGRLTFARAATFPNTTLERIFAEVGDGSADYGMRSARAEHGRSAEAAARLARARHRDHPDNWFVLGLDSTAQPVGYVQSAIAGPGRAFLAEIGVIESRRGHRYVDELLAYGTAVVVDAGLTTLVSDTDHDNRAMRAAFARGGYVEFATRQDFRWRTPT